MRRRDFEFKDLSCDWQHSHLRLPGVLHVALITKQLPSFSRSSVEFPSYSPLIILQASFSSLGTTSLKQASPTV